MAGVFSRLLPLAEESAVRIVLVNRRDYPGSVPIGDDDRSLLVSANSSTHDVLDNLQLYMKARAQEFHDFLLSFAVKEHIGPSSMIVAGWSFGATWILSLLAYAPSLPVIHGSQPLYKFIKRVVAYGKSVFTIPVYHY